ncbi:hypothetical protein BGX34_012221 [Mortierella sp. NVP85]|nr:hypothetical protein BGX34_012221 [Mortierella sp. NVP85]
MPILTFPLKRQTTVEIPTAEPGHLQAFRDSLTSRTVHIPARFDKKTRKHVILWRDIQSIFKDAECIVLGDELVPLLVDDSLELLQPPRINQCPGAVLDIVAATSRQAVEPSPEIHSRVSTITELVTGLPNLTMGKCDHIAIGEASASAVGSVRTTGENTNIYPTVSNAESSSSTSGEHSQVHGSYEDRLSTVLRQFSELTHATTQVMDRRHQSLQRSRQHANQPSCSANTPGRLGQTSIINDIRSNPHMTTQDAIFHMLQRLLENQQQILNNQAAHFRQTQELLEYSTPRLFVILPKPRRKRDALLKPFREQFKLFFLCEYDHHMDGGCHTPHRIHLAKHEGYDLVKVDEFFKKYGSHILTIMEILRVGITAAGAVVPGFSHLGIIQGIESVSKTFELASRNFRPLFDDAITSFKTRIKGDNEPLERMFVPGQMDFNYLKALEGADLRQLGSFFRDHDPDHVLGNLNRMVTLDGGVRWVCNDHYHKDSSNAAVERLRAIVEVNGGKFLVLSSWNYVHVAIKGRLQAKELYEAMVKTPRIQHLAITLQWEVTQDDLEALETAVTKTGIPWLSIHIHLADTSRFKILSKCYNPIVQLMCNGYVESMSISFESFYQRISKFPVMMKSRLEVLQIHSTFSPGDKSQKSVLKFILKHSPLLRKLEIAPDDLHDAFEFLANQAPQYLNLEDISWTTLHSTLKLELSQGIAQDVEMTIMCLDNLSQDVQKLIQQGCLTKIVIREAIDATNGSRMVEILQHNPRLAHVNLRVHPRFIATVVGLIIVGRRALIKDKAISSATWCDTLKMSIDWEVLGSIEDGSIEDGSTFKISLDFPENSATPTIEIFMKDAMTPEMMGHMLELVRGYSWSIQRLETNHLFTDDFAIALENGTGERGSDLIALSVCPRSMTFAGLECMDRVIERSRNMTKLHFNFLDLQDEAEREKATHLLRRHRTVHSLSMTGYPVNVWIREVSKVCPTRSELPKLSSLQLNCKLQEIANDGLRWIKEMLSTTSDTIWNTDEPLTEFPMNRGWQQLHEVILHDDLRLRYQDVVNHIDFLKRVHLSDRPLSFQIRKLMRRVEQRSLLSPGWTRLETVECQLVYGPYDDDDNQ